MRRGLQDNSLLKSFLSRDESSANPAQAEAWLIMPKRRAASDQRLPGDTKRPRPDEASDMGGNLRPESRPPQWFEYPALMKPASQIRLLRVHGAPEDALLVGDLIVHDIDEAPEYSAISYTWGPETPREAIMVNGQRMMVRTACHYALRQARLFSPEPSILLWIDSICINQLDLEEKAHQVGMIASIFEQAEQTFVCIGPHEADSQLVCQHLTHLDDRCEDEALHYDEECESCVAMLDKEGEFAVLSEADDPVHSLHEWASELTALELERLDEALYRFGERSYWERMWIYPEVAKSRQIVLFCGDNAVTMDVVRWIIGLFHWVTLGVADKDALAERLVRHVKRYESNGPIWQVMVAYFAQDIGPLGGWLDYLMNGLKCFYRADTIYASRDVLTSDQHFDVPQVDYQKSAVQLVREVLPHIGMVGIGFPANVRMLLDLVSDDHATDSGYLQALWDNRNGKAPQRSADTTSAKASVRCDCGFPSPSRTAIWRCSLWHDEQSGAATLRRGTGGQLQVSFSRELSTYMNSKKYQADLLTQRPPGSLSLTGVDMIEGSSLVIGCISSQAKPGDFLIADPGGARGHRYLVLRYVYDEIHEVIGCAVILPSIGLRPGSRQQHEVPFVGEVIVPEQQEVDSAFFDFWLDADDVLAHAFPLGNRSGKLEIQDTLRLVNHSSTRSRFSSFATACSGDRPINLDSSCPECATGTKLQLCVECGVDLTGQ